MVIFSLKKEKEKRKKVIQQEDLMLTTKDGKATYMNLFFFGWASFYDSWADIKLKKPLSNCL